MANKRIFFFAAAALVVIALTSCVTSTGSVEKVGWSEYTFKPSKDYTVVGAINIKVDNPITLNYELMVEAIKMGGHDILNVRTDVERIDTTQKILTASAVVIKYTNESLKSKNTQIIQLGDRGSQTTSDENYIFADGGGSAPQPAGDTKGKKKFLGIF